MRPNWWESVLHSRERAAAQKWWGRPITTRPLDGGNCVIAAARYRALVLGGREKKYQQPTDMGLRSLLSFSLDLVDIFDLYTADYLPLLWFSLIHCSRDDFPSNTKRLYISIRSLEQ
jgi:hypothetical protein